MTDITIKRKKRLKKSSTLSMHVDKEILEKFRNKCINDFDIRHTDVLRDFIERIVTGEVKINIKE